MAIGIVAYGTSDPGAREFSVWRYDVDVRERLGGLTIRLAEVPALIAELSEWVEE